MPRGRPVGSVAPDRIKVEDFRPYFQEKRAIARSQGMNWQRTAHWMGITMKEYEYLERALNRNGHGLKSLPFDLVDRIVTTMGDTFLLAEWAPLEDEGSNNRG